MEPGGQEGWCAAEWVRVMEASPAGSGATASAKAVPRGPRGPRPCAPRG